MNIKILDSWLREHVKTDASPKKIGELLSLTSVGVERIEKYKNDIVYDIEVTTNRPELMSVMGLAREAATVLPQNGIKAKLVEHKLEMPKVSIKNSPEMHINIDPKLVRRVMAVVMEVTIKDSTQTIKDRLESSDIRSLNNVIDVTNYIMRETGHPTHAFDYDRLKNHTLNIRESKKGEKMRTLDKKDYVLTGGDIVADDGTGEINDLLGVMGTENSVVTKDTKRILFFIDSVEPNHIRKTSMEYGIRTEAAVLNEKGLNPEHAQRAFIMGIKLFQKVADAKIVSNIIDLYPEKPKSNVIKVTEEKINQVVGIQIPLKQSIDILTKLGFEVKQKDTTLEVTVPPELTGEDMLIPEDLIEEIARIYGYHNIPNKLPAIIEASPVHLEENEFYWEDRVRDAFKYWGFTEVYTYPMVSEELSVKPVEQVVKIQNQLSDDMVYMRRSLIPGLQQIVKDNLDHDVIKIFEIANVYEKNGKNLPKQLLRLGGLIRKPKVSFYEAKGYLEQLFEDTGIANTSWKLLDGDRYGATVYVGKEELGVVEIIDDHTVDFELDFGIMLKHVVLKKVYKPISKFPPIVEDMAVIAPANILTGDLMDAIAKQSALITDVSLLDKYKETRTFHIVYQSYTKNLTDKEVGGVREKIIKMLKDKYQAVLK
jgi:phenylalanyl-tRNA synthetase beta chain